MGDELAISSDEVRTGNGILSPVDEPETDAGGHERTYPALAVLPSLRHVADEPVEDAMTVVVAKERPELVDKLPARRRPRAEDSGEARRERAFAREAPHERADRACEELLDASWPVGLGEEPAVQKAESS